MYLLRIVGTFGLIFSSTFLFQLAFFFLGKNEIIFFVLFLIFVAITLYTFTPSFVLEKILKRLEKKIEEQYLANLKGIVGTFLFILFAIYTVFTKFLLKEDFSVQIDEVYISEYAKVEFSLQGKTLFLSHHVSEYTKKDVDIDEEKIIPLTFPPSSYILLCKSYDEGLVYYQSDRFGFRNKDEVWEKNPDIIVLGSYLVHGFCTHNPFWENISEDLKLNILSLGQGGADPLISLAIFKEFAYNLSPQAIFLFITQSDVLNISKSYRDDFLKLYLKRDDFRQGLKEILRKPEVQFKIESEFRKYEMNERQKDFEKLRKSKKTEKKDSITEKLFSFFRTPEFVRFVKRKLEKPKKISDLDLMVLALTLKEFRSISKKIGAKFVVVYIPEEIEISKGFFSNYRKIKGLVEKLNIKFYDLINKIEEQEKLKQKPGSVRNYHLLLAEEFAKIIRKEEIK
jgi:hypothetical protein